MAILAKFRGKKVISILILKHAKNGALKVVIGKQLYLYKKSKWTIFIF